MCDVFLEVPDGVEPPYKVLQTSAQPLGHGTFLRVQRYNFFLMFKHLLYFFLKVNRQQTTDNSFCSNSCSKNLVYIKKLQPFDIRLQPFNSNATNAILPPNGGFIFLIFKVASFTSGNLSFIVFKILLPTFSNNFEGIIICSLTT